MVVLAVRDYSNIDLWGQTCLEDASLGWERRPVVQAITLPFPGIASTLVLS